MSKLDVKAIRERADAATAGPWSYDEGEEGYEFGPADWQAYQAPPFSEAGPHPMFVPNNGGFTEAQREQILADERFIAHARTDVPVLCDRIAELVASDERRKDTYRKPDTGWVCFHCGERFLDPDEARAHFGESPDEVVRLRAEIARLNGAHA